MPSPIAVDTAEVPVGSLAAQDVLLRLFDCWMAPVKGVLADQLAEAEEGFLAIVVLRRRLLDRVTPRPVGRLSSEEASWFGQLPELADVNWFLQEIAPYGRVGVCGCLRLFAWQGAIQELSSVALGDGDDLSLLGN